MNDPSPETTRLSPPLFFRVTGAVTPVAVPPTRYVLRMQVTAMLVTSAEPIVPNPLATMQVKPTGALRTWTAYIAPVTRRVGKANAPSALMVSMSTPFLRTSEPVTPVAEPPTR